MSACEAVADALAQGLALTEAQRNHLVQCDRCASLAAAHDSLARALHPDAPAPSMAPSLRSALATLTPSRTYSAARLALAPVALLASLVAFALLASPRLDLAEQRTRALYLTHGFTLVALVLLAGAGVLSRGPLGLGLPLAWRRALALGAPAVLLLSTALTLGGTASSLHLAGPLALQAGLGCALVGSTLALLGIALAFAAARRAVLSAPALTGALLGASAGLMASLVQHLHCPVVDPSHCLTAHLVPTVVGLAVGALAGRRWLKP